MSKRCIIYYGTVINQEGGGWAHKGDQMEEPVKVEGKQPVGKNPEFCCKELEEAQRENFISFIRQKDHDSPYLAVYNHWNCHCTKIRFCPFCGAEITLKENLKLKVIATPVTHHQYHIEAVS